MLRDFMLNKKGPTGPLEHLSSGNLKSADPAVHARGG